MRIQTLEEGGDSFFLLSQYYTKLIVAELTQGLKSWMKVTVAQRALPIQSKCIVHNAYDENKDVNSSSS